jgi:hypothetical protein
MICKPDQVSDRLVWARLRIHATANEMGIEITLQESEKFALILLGLEDDEAVERAREAQAE